MSYDHRLVEQESDHADHIPDDSDFFVVENWGHDDAIFCELNNLLKGSPPRSTSRKAAWLRCREWLKEKHPEFLM